jgi:hypothetical protein
VFAAPVTTGCGPAVPRAQHSTAGDCTMPWPAAVLGSSSFEMLSQSHYEVLSEIGPAAIPVVPLYQSAKVHWWFCGPPSPPCVTHCH